MRNWIIEKNRELKILGFMKFQDDSKNRAREGKSQRAGVSTKARVLGKRDHRLGEVQLKTSSGIANVSCL